MCNNNKIPASNCLRGLLFKNEPKKWIFKACETRKTAVY